MPDLYGKIVKSASLNGAISSRGGGGTTAGALVVTATFTSAAGGDCDKTTSEIKDAMDAGRVVYFTGTMPGVGTVKYLATGYSDTGSGVAIAAQAVDEPHGAFYDFYMPFQDDGYRFLLAERQFLDTNLGSANAGKVLKVNSSGIVVPEDDRFVVTLTPTAADYSGTMDKTVAEIDTAWKAGKGIWFRIYAGTDFTDVPCDRVGKTSLTYPSFNAAMLYDEMNMFVLIYTGTTSNGSKQTYSTKLYPLATGQWTGGSY